MGPDIEVGVMTGVEERLGGREEVGVSVTEPVVAVTAEVVTAWVAVTGGEVGLPARWVLESPVRNRAATA